jgi:RsiW-degrading membrane proteinase PrsW (M82 family)
MIERSIQSIAAFVPIGIMLAYGIIRSRGDWRNDALWVAVWVASLFSFLAVGIEFVAKAALPLLNLPPLANAFAAAAGVAALPEEAVKLAAVLIALSHVDARRMRDVILLSLAAAMGFAAMENFLYVVGTESWGFRAALRAGTSIPGHALDGLAMGSFLTLARVAKQGRNLYFCLSLLAPTCLHAAYDFPLLAFLAQRAAWLIILWLVVLLASAISVTLLTDRVLAKATGWDQRQKPESDGLRNNVVIAIGFGFVAIGTTLGLLVHWMSTAQLVPSILTGLVTGFLPVFFGLDLVRAGFVGIFRGPRLSRAVA